MLYDNIVYIRKKAYMEKIAVYCVNSIENEDIERAKKEDLGIFLACNKYKEISSFGTHK